MKFIYTFQKVLDVKTNEKKQAESELSQSIAMMAEAERKLADLLYLKAQAQEQLSELAVAKGTAAEMMEIQQYIDFLDLQLRRARRNVAAAEQQVSERRQQLTVRTVEEKVWVKAKEKAFAEYRLEADRRAQAETDEMALMRSRLAQ